MRLFAYALAALVVLQSLVIFALSTANINAYRDGYDAAILDAELITLDEAGYVLRFGDKDDFQIHEYEFEEAS